MKKYEYRDFSQGRDRGACVTSKELCLSSFYSPSPVDDFMHSKHKPAHDSKESIRLTSDIYMLFNQQRLDKMTLQQLAVHFNSMVTKEPAFASLKSKLTDAQLASIVKSRYIQTPSELLAYSRYLNSLADEQIQAVVRAAQIKQQQEKQQQQDNNEPAPAPAELSAQ